MTSWSSILRLFEALSAVFACHLLPLVGAGLRVRDSYYEPRLRPCALQVRSIIVLRPGGRNICAGGGRPPGRNIGVQTDRRPTGRGPQHVRVRALKSLCTLT